MPDDAASQLRIQLLGQFAVWVDGERIPDARWRLRRARSLVKLLALAPGHRLHRDQVMDMLWPDSDLKSAANSLHQTLRVTRQLLDPAGAGWLRLEDGFLSLGGATGQQVWVDVDQFEAAAAEITAATAAGAEDGPDLAVVQAALDLYQGELLPEDRYEEWAGQRRETLSRQYVGLLLTLAQRLEARREFPQAISALEKVLAVERANEEAHAGLMRLYALSGKRGQALRQYQVMREALLAEMDAPPGEAAARLHEAIQAGRFPPPGESPLEVELSIPASPPDAPPSAPEQAAPRHNLPVRLTSFIGRERELAVIEQLLDKHRLVTLTGPGGMGKTSLALQAAEQVLDRFARGTWLVELAPVADPSGVARAVMESLGMFEQPGQDLETTLVRALKRRCLLLVLDNCEHLIAGVAPLAVQILQQCPDVRILVTSREILGVEGEIPFRCPSLTLPKERPAGLEALAQSEAVRLFVERARASVPSFTLTEANAGPVVRICRQLDGIPLAIELAAARARVLSVDQIAARLDNVFALLTGGSRSALPRHQTLRALIDWSYRLLLPEERTLLMRLSVFAGGWTLEAAEQVCSDSRYDSSPAASAAEQVCSDTPPAGKLDASGAGTISSDEGAARVSAAATNGGTSENGSHRLRGEQILDLLGGLIDKSLIQFEPSANVEPHAHYHMLETVRQYARERLVEAGEEAAARERHLDFYLSLALQAGPHLRAWGAREWLDRLDWELGNLRQALDWSQAGSVEKGLRLITSLDWFWWCRSHLPEGVDRFSKLLQAQEKKGALQTLDLSGRVARGRALLTLGFWNKMDYDVIFHFPFLTVEQCYQESHAIFQPLGEAYRLDALLSRFLVARTREELFELRSLFLRMNERFWAAECDNAIAASFPITDDSACFYEEEAMALRKEMGDLDGIAYCYSNMAERELSRGNFQRWVEFMKESVACFEQVGNRARVADRQGDIALTFIHYGKYQEATRHLVMMMEAIRDIDNPFEFLKLQNLQAYLALANRDFERVLRIGEEIMESSKEQPGMVFLQRWALYYLSRAALALGQLDRARAYLKLFVPLALMLSDPPRTWDVIVTFQVLGILAEHAGDMQQAAAFFGAHAALRELHKNNGQFFHIPVPERGEYEQALAAARAALGEEAFNAVWAAGGAMTADQVVQAARDYIEGHT